MKKAILLSASLFALLFTSCEKPEPTFCYKFRTSAKTETTYPSHFLPSVSTSFSETEQCGITESEAQDIATSASSTTIAYSGGAKITTTIVTTYTKK